MEIKLNDKYSIEHKNGYWIYHEHSVTKEKGLPYKSKTKTYAKMLDLHHNLKLQDVDGNLIMNNVQILIDENQKEAGRWVLSERAKKAKKNE